MSIGISSPRWQLFQKTQAVFDRLSPNCHETYIIEFVSRNYTFER